MQKLGSTKLTPMLPAEDEYSSPMTDLGRWKGGKMCDIRPFSGSILPVSGVSLDIIRHY